MATSDESEMKTINFAGEAPLAGDPLRWSQWYASKTSTPDSTFLEKRGAPITKIETWWSNINAPNPNGALRGMRMTFHDGYVSPIYGVEQDYKNEVDLKFGERVTGFDVWSATDREDKDLFVNSMRFFTDEGQAKLLGNDKNHHYWYWTNPYGGFLFGVEGKIGKYETGLYIDSFRTAWIHSVDAVHCDMKYLSFPDPGTIDSVSFKTLDGNNLHSDQPFQMEIGEEETETNEMTTTKTDAEEFSTKVGCEVSVSGKVFGIGAEAKATAETEVRETSTTSRSSSYSKSHTIYWRGSITVPPRTHYKVELMYYKLYIALKFEPEIVFITENEERLSYKTKPKRISGGASGVATFTVTKIPQESRSNQMFGLDGKPMLLGGAEQDTDAIIRIMTGSASNPLTAPSAPSK